MDSGALCVMMVSVQMMLIQCVNNWDTQELRTKSILLDCEYCYCAQCG